MAYLDLTEVSGLHTRPLSMPIRCLNPYQVRTDFPILEERPRGKRLIYLDNAATSQKPQQVIDSLNRYYRKINANVHRGVHFLSERSTMSYESARRRIQRFFSARSEKEIIFVRGATEGINLVAQTFGRKVLGQGDEIILSQFEHHSNIVPWQLIAQQTGAVIKVIPMTVEGELLISEYEKMLSPKTRLVSIAHVSNALGTINPVKRIIRMAHENNIPVLVDGAQAAPHMPVDLQDLDCDFYVASGHKMYGPTGIGILYGKSEHLEEMPPWQGGGEMIRRVSFEESTYIDIPHRFEAGTPDIAGAIGLGEAVDYLTRLDMQQIREYEDDLLEYAENALTEIKGLQIIGAAANKAGIISFVMDNAHPHDIATILDQEGIAVRAGHHCAMPVMKFLGLSSTTRASLSFYNTREEIDILVKAIHKVKQIFK